MSLSNYAEQALLQHMLKISAFTQPTNLYIGLSTADPGEDGSTNAEPSGNAYARVQTNASWVWSSNHVENTATISFPAATGSWGTVSHFTIWDAITGGNLLASTAMSASKTINNTDQLQFPAGQITFTFD